MSDEYNNSLAMIPTVFNFVRCMCQMESGPLVALIRKLMILMKAGTFFLHEQGGNTLTGQHSAVMKKLCKRFPFCSLLKDVNRSIFFFLACFQES